LYEVSRFAGWLGLVTGAGLVLVLGEYMIRHSERGSVMGQPNARLTFLVIAATSVVVATVILGLRLVT